MRIALVSDIHSNVLALRPLLTFLDENPDIDWVLNAGDLVGVGPHPREVADLVCEDRRFRNVVGNNEEAIVEAQEAAQGTSRHRLWQRQRLAGGLAERVCGFPRVRLDVIGGVRVLTCHSRPDSTSDLPYIYQRKSVREFHVDYESETPDVVVFGHTHEPFLLRNEGRLFVNPGSLGISREGRGSFAVLHLDESGRREVEFRSVGWNMEDLARDFIKRDVPDKEFILERYFGVHSMMG